MTASMTPVEERLAAALTARADQVPTDATARPLVVRRRRSPAPWLAAAAVLVVVAGAALVLRPGGGGAPAPTPSPTVTSTSPALPRLGPVHPALAGDRWYDEGEVFSPNGPDTLPTVDLRTTGEDEVTLFWGLSGVGHSVVLTRDRQYLDRWRLLGATTAGGGFLVRWDAAFEHTSLPSYHPGRYRWVVADAGRLVVLDVPRERSFGFDARRDSSLWLDPSGSLLTWENAADGFPARGETQQVRVFRWQVRHHRAVPTELGTYCVRPFTDGDTLDTIRVPRPC